MKKPASKTAFHDKKFNPEYSDIFEYLEENYEMKCLETPLSDFYKQDIAEFQYPRLEGEKAERKVSFDGVEEAAELVREFAEAAGADLVGFTKVKEKFVFRGSRVKGSNTVVLAMEMDFEKIALSPEPEAGIEVLRVYWRLGEVMLKVADFIRTLGYEAQAHHPRSFTDFPPTILHPAAAYEAGLGEFGRLGLLITEKFGPRVRLASITTDLELPQNDKPVFGVEEFCRTCKICRNACDGDAIPDEKTVVRGFGKYTIDPYKCLPYFAKYDGCNKCVASCPFNKKPDELAKFVKLTKKLVDSS